MRMMKQKCKSSNIYSNEYSFAYITLSTWSSWKTFEWTLLTAFLTTPLLSAFDISIGPLMICYSPDIISRRYKPLDIWQALNYPHHSTLSVKNSCTTSWKQIKLHILLMAPSSLIRVVSSLGILIQYIIWWSLYNLKEFSNRCFIKFLILLFGIFILFLLSSSSLSSSSLLLLHYGTFPADDASQD